MQNSKICFKCGDDKPLSEFYKHSGMKDGHLNKCKNCNKIDVANNYKNKKQQYQVYEKERFKRTERKEHILKYQQKRRKKFPEKARAWNAVSNAIRDGRLIRLPCQNCGDERSQAHHTNYSKPLDVEWLCFKCHRHVHGQEVMDTVNV